jgi:LuxR family quorum sensing-dependent transcriptional regulator
MRRDVAEFIQAANTSNAPGVMLHEFQELISTLGYGHFIVSGLPTVEPQPRALVAHDAWPKGWMDRFEEEKFYLDDPVCGMALRSARPFTWAEARASAEETNRARQICSEAAEFGLRDGYAMPLASLSSWQTIVSIATDTPSELDQSIRGDIYLASAFLCSAVDKSIDIENGPRLSRREKEVLQWTAAGKTMWETSVVLSISQKTVEHHLGRIRAKLNTATTPQAIARAIADRHIPLP